MAANEIDLWPTDLLDQVDTIRTPLAILREQAEFLGKKSNNLVEARVRTSQKKPPTNLTPFNAIETQIRNASNDINGTGANDSLSEPNPILVQSFYLVSPVLSYSYQLFYVTHPLQGYPLAVIFEDQVFQAKSEGEFVAILKEIFSSEKTKHIIEAMVAQSVA